MNDDLLKRLLHDADGVFGTAAGLSPSNERAGAPHDAVGTPLGIDVLETQIARHRTRRRRVLTATAVSAAAAMLLVASWPGSDRPTDFAHQGSPLPAQATDAGRVPVTLPNLYAEIAQRKRLVATLRHAQAVDRAEAELAMLEREIGAAPRIQAQLAFRREVDRAAILNLTVAEGLDQDLGETAAAAAEYRRVAERFPNTHWATIANEALARVDAM